MAIPLETLRSYIIGSTTVTGLIGTRVYPVLAPQQPTRPYAVIQQISGPREHTMEQVPATLASPRFQIKSYAATYTGTTAQSGAKEVSEAIRKRLDGSESTGTPDIQAAYIANEFDFFEEDSESYVILSDYIVWHTEAT